MYVCNLTEIFTRYTFTTYLWSPCPSGSTSGKRCSKTVSPSSTLSPGMLATNQCQNSDNVLDEKRKKMSSSLMDILEVFPDFSWLSKYALLYYPWIFQVRVLFWPWTIMSQLYVTRSENFFCLQIKMHTKLEIEKLTKYFQWRHFWWGARGHVPTTFSGFSK